MRARTNRAALDPRSISATVSAMGRVSGPHAARSSHTIVTPWLLSTVIHRVTHCPCTGLPGGRNEDVTIGLPASDRSELWRRRPDRPVLGAPDDGAAPGGGAWHRTLTMTDGLVEKQHGVGVRGRVRP